ncbi:putative membrane protein/domain protein (plasmid) [Mycolicibacterium chubuense NBB4]|uniref:Putative membrane protein/domain protein n=1 Tax=Mycolicibacterium chubuense (strain NBB4) TaxID=710421 RepID=I4BTD4_MYCCN|nr:RDD family protein [Mycolicibacterium chubuense]AFM20541.1 putative membrane protein/domain protein [Mycolicibacterium chubuense NBB4]
MTSATTKAESALQSDLADGLAPWMTRAGALAVDILPGAAVFATAIVVALSVPVYGGWWWTCIAMGTAAIALTVANRLLLPMGSGQTLGRAVHGISVFQRDAEAGPSRLLLRDLAHLLDTAAFFAGWLWPLWDSRRRTFADKLLRTEVRLVEPRSRDGDPRARAAAVLVSAALLCAGGAALSYAVVREHDRSIEDTRDLIASQGPHMVEQMLSYRPETVQSDFDHARSLASDKYRAQLSAQQQAVQKATPIRNEYWVTNSAVLTATPDSATMLVFLQGQRGAPPSQRYITASVRATFVKSPSAGWQVDDLAIVTKPQTAGAGP